MTAAAAEGAANATASTAANSTANSTAGTGRPRDPATDAAILDATIALLCERGFAATSIEAVAAAAGVSRPTVYRRYPNRDALHLAAARHAFAQVQPREARSADPRDRVIDLLEDTVAMLEHSPVGPLFRAAIPYLPQAPELARLANAFGGARRQVLAAALQEAVAAGAIAPPADAEVLLDALTGALYMRYFITGRPLDRSWLERLVAELP